MSRSKPNRSPLGDFDVITGPPWAFSPQACPVVPPAILQRPAEPAAAAPPRGREAGTPTSDRRAESS
jgi:hypothetical protein